MDLSIIIVNYKAWNSLSVTLDGLKNILNENQSFEVIVVDNFSNDGRLKLFEVQYPDFVFAENSGNWGFADACNLGAGLAKTNYLLFLNPDTLPNASALLALYSGIIEHPEYGILSCLQNDRNEHQIKLWPNIFTLFGFTRMFYRLMNRRSIVSRSCQQRQFAHPDWISGSIVMMSKTWFDKVDGWDADYWLYSEDTDLSRRIADQGGLIGLMCGYKMVHLHGGASRIDRMTTQITKSEVKISNHVYVQKHFKSHSKTAAHSLLIFNNVIFNFPGALLGLLLFFIPNMNMYWQVYRRTVKYYASVFSLGTWISPRSKHFNSRLKANIHPIS